MRYKKHMIILLAAIFLFAMATASATDSNNTAVAVEDTDQMELSAGNQMAVDNLKTSKNAAIVQTDLEVLGAGEEGTYNDLRDEIGSGGDINLNKSYYRYAGGGTIGITTPKFINGNGAVIDMAGSTIRAFTVFTSGVTFTNLTIKNANYAGSYGVIYFKGSGTVTNCNFINNTAFKGGAIGFEFGFTGYLMDCNFTDNKATSGSAGAVYILSNGNIRNCNFIGNSATPSWGGAIYMYSGSIENCNFTNNTASNNGAAVYFWNSGNVANCNFDNNFASNNGGAISFSGSNSVCILENCNFTNNTANCDGGAVYFNSNGTVTNCSFADNFANQGGAIFSQQAYITADTCIFKTNSDSTNINMVIRSPTLNVDNFTTLYGSGEKLTFNLTTDSGRPVTNGNISISVYFKDNNSWVGNYSCLSGEGWIPDLPVGSYYAIFDTEYAEFQPINRTITVMPDNTFWALNYIINSNNNAVINLTNDYYFNPDYDAAFVDGIVINRLVTFKGNAYTIDAERQACIFQIQNRGVVLENITFINGVSSGSRGGAISISGNVINCNFINNTAPYGGAIGMGFGNVINCNFINNSAQYGGAVYFDGTGNVSNCNFTDNSATVNGGAVYFNGTGEVTNCNFTNNTASGDGGAVYFNGKGDVTNCNFTDNKATGDDGCGGAVFFIDEGTVSNCNFTNNSASYVGAVRMFSGSVENCNFTGNKATGDDGCGGAVHFLYVGDVSNCNFTDNHARDGGAVSMTSGSVEKCNFTDNHAVEGGAVWMESGSVEKCNFTDNHAVEGGAVSMTSGSVEKCNFINNTASGDGGAVWMGFGSVSNSNFINNTASGDGGAVSMTGSVEKCNFINNTASGDGGAVWMGFGSVSNSNFINNTASGDGGAVYFNGKGDVTNCNFTGNNATTGSAIYFLTTFATKTISNSRFLNNRANAEALEITKNDNNITIIFTGQNNLLNAIYSPDEVTFTNVTYWGANGITTISATMSVSNKEEGQNITVGVVVNDKLVLRDVMVTDESGMIVLDIIAGENYYISARHDADSYYTEAEKTISNNTKFNANVTSQTTTNKTVNITAKSNIYSEVMPSKLLFILPNGTEINATYASNGTWWAVHTFDDYGVYQVNASYAGLGNVTVNKGTIAVTAPEHTFWFLNYTINGNDNPVINLNNDFYFDSAYDEEFANGITINRKLTINGNGHSINALQKARILQITAGNVVLNNITFANAIASDNGGAICMKSGTVKNCNFAGNSAKQGGAVYFSDDGNVSDCNFANNSAGNAGAVFIVNDGNVSDCNFANNSAGNAGAVFIVNDGNVSDCNFANNSASGDCGAVLIVHHGNVANCNFTGNAATIDGGAVGMDSGSIANCNFVNNSASNSSGAVYFFYDVDVTNCNFTGNKAISGSAIYFYFASGIKSISDSLFLNNRANADDGPFNVTINGNGVEITFKGLNNLLNAIYSRGDVKFSNVTYWGADGITNTDSFTPDISNRPAGQNITVKGIVNGNIINAIKVTDENGSIVLGDAGDYWIVLSHKEDSYYTEVAETLFTNMKLYANVTSLTTNNKTVNITAKSNIFNEVMPSKLLFVLSNSENITANYAGNGTWWAEHTFDDYGEFKVNASYVGLDNVAVNDATINITKADSTITLDNITLNYGESKNVTIIAQGASGITANINGTNVTVINNYTIMIADLGAGNYTLTVTTVPDGDHNPVTATSKITVNKVESTLTVDNITFDYNSEGSGDVSFTGADKVIANVINQPKAVVNVAGKRITVSGLAAGTYTLNVTTVADENHTAVRETAAITVNKVNSTLMVGDVDLDYGESKNVTVTVQGATSITAKVDDVDVGVIDFVVQVSDLAAGIHTLTVTSIPDENHTAVSETAIITVNKVNSTLMVGDVDLDYGESKNVAVTAQGATSITAKVDDVNVGVIDFVVPVSDLATGTHTLTVTSIPDENHTAVTETATITVNKADSTLTVPAISFDYGDSGSSEVEFTGATGVVAVVNDLHAVVDVNGKTITVFNLTAGTYILTVTTIPDDNHNEVTKTAAVTVLKQDVDVNISMPENVTAGEKSTVNVVLPGDASGNVVAKVDGEIADNVTVADGSASLEIPSLGGGNHTIEIVYSGDSNYKSALKTAVLTVGRDSTNMTAADVTATYKISKYLVINLADSRGNPLANAIVTVELTTAKNYTSDENGQIKVKVSNLVPKTYAAKITFKGNDNYTGSNTTAEVTVKKATAKITAKAKTFSTTTKTKKYKITLKDSKGNPIKKAVVSLKVNGNTYKATTNSKGKATFKITKLSNKGTYKATVTFKANKYYKKATKNAKITVKSVWKTVAKGSKNHAIVKKIQRALKSNGYYLSYNGHYLMVDGIYHDYTKMAVKQFQKANGLKVTGKVDEKTAKKLKLI